MQTLITTPGGNVGSQVTKLLLSQNVPVRLATRNVAKVKEQFPTAEVVYFDYTDQSTFAPALAGIDHIFLASPDGQEAEPEISLVEAGRKLGLKRVVKLSAFGVEGTDFPHRQIEKYLETTDLEWTFLRPNWFMQIYSTTHVEELKHGMLLEPTGDTPTAFIDTRDIAAVAGKALTEEGHHGQTYSISGAQSLTRFQVVEYIAAAIGKPVEYKPLSDAEFRQMVAEWFPAEYIDVLSLIYEKVRDGEFSPVTNTVKQVLGRDPITFAQFAQDYRQVWL